jgi:probable F420-dependent oxidoreductase
LREYVQSIRAIWRCWEHGEPLKFEGEHYQFTLMTPEFSPPKTGFPLPPISLAAVGPDMLRMAGRIADGVRLHSFCTRKYIENVCMPKIEEGMARDGRNRKTIEISGGGFICTGPDEEAVKKRVDWARYRVGFYGSTRTYLPVFEQHGLEDLGLKLHSMSKEGRWSELAGEVSDDVVALFAAIGTYNELPKAISDSFGGVVDTIRLDLPDDIDNDQHAELIAKLKTIPTKFQAFDTAA